MTSRERLLLGVLILGVFLYAPFAALDWRATQEERLIDAMTEASAARLQAAQARRIEAATADRTALEDMRGWGFDASNTAVAQVVIEQRLVEAAAAAGLADLQIATDAEIETVGETQWLGAEVQSSLRWGPAFAFLDALASWPEGFRVTRFQYDVNPQVRVLQPDELPPPPEGRIVMGVSFPVNLPVDAEASATAPATPAAQP